MNFSNLGEFPEAEKGFLGGIMCYPKENLHFLKMVEADFFQESEFRDIFLILCSMESEKISPETVFSEIRRREKDFLLNSADDAVLSGNVEIVTRAHFETLRAAHRARTRRALVEDAARHANAGDEEAFADVFSALRAHEEARAHTHAQIERAGALIDAELPPRNAVLEGVFDLGDKVAIFAPSKTRKTFFALQFALCAATARAFLAWEIPRAFRVLFIQFEIKPEHFARRVQGVARALGINADARRDNLRIINARGVEFCARDAMRYAKETRAEVIIFDPLYKMVDGDENSAHEMKPILAEFDRLARETGAAVVYIHHDAKGSAGDRDIRDRGAGSGVLTRDYDAGITLTPHRDAEDAIVCQPLLRNYPPQEKFVAEFENGKFEISEILCPVEKTSRNARKKQELSLSDAEIVEQADCPMMMFRERLGGLGLTDSNVRAVVKDSVGKGLLEQYRRPGTRETWIATPERMAEQKKDWRF